MKTAYIFHDAFNNTTSDWYLWMKTTLEGMGYAVFIPQFPTPAAQSYESWKAIVKNYLPTFDDETLLLGHGTGGVFALRIVEELSVKIRGLFLIASYAEKIGHEGYDRINTSFVEHQLNWEKIKSNVNILGVFAGSDDPFVPMNITENLAKNLGETPIIIPDGGHLNKASGFTQLVPVAQEIKDRLQALDKSIVVEQEVVEQIVAPKTTPPADAVHPSSIEEGSRLPKGGQGVVGKARTMYQDMSQLVNSNKGSVAASLLGTAREKEAIKKIRSPLSTKNIFYIIGTIILILTGGGALGYVAYQYIPASQTPGESRVPSLIPSDTTVGIDIAQKTFYELKDAIQKSLAVPLAQNTLQDTVYLSVNQFVSFSDVAKKIEMTTLPTILSEQFRTALSDKPRFMHGTFNQHHFLVIPFENYDTMFQGMNEWEPTLFQDIGVFMNISQSFLKGYTTRGIFSDEIILNRNARVLRYTPPAPKTPETSPVTSGLFSITSGTAEITSTEENFFTDPEPILLAPYQAGDFMVGYFFLNQRTLVIIDHPDVIPEIISRWANQQLFR